MIRKLIVPLLTILCVLVGCSTLYSPERTLFVFISITVIIAIFLEPFVGAIFYLVCLYVRPFEILPIPRSIPVMKLLAVCTLAIWVLNIIIYRKRTFVKAPQNILIIAFLIALMASHKGYIHGAVDVFSEFSKIVIIYFLLVNLITNERRLKATIWVLILCTTYLAVQGVLMSRGITIGGINTRIESRVISTGVFADPNDLAMTLIVGIPFVYYFFFFGRFVISRIILVALGGLILYCILLTASRGGMIGLAVVAYLLLRGKVGTILGAVLTTLCLIGVLAIAPSYTLERLETASLSEGTGHSRIEHWADGWRMFTANPILGVGMNNYPDFAEGYAAHNSSVHVAGEAGITGLLIWISLFYFAFKSLVTTERKIGKTRGMDFNQTMVNSLRGSLIGFLVCTLFLSRQYQYIPYILIALSVSTYHVSGRQDGSMWVSIKDMMGILVITFGFIVLWYVTVRKFA